MFVSGGSTFETMVRIGDHIYSSISSEFLSEITRETVVMQAIGLGPKAIGIEQNISRAIYHITQLFIIIGMINLFTRLLTTRFYREFAAMSIVSILLLVLCIVLPYFSAALNMTRIYHITLLFLSPFCILGGIAVFQWFAKAFKVHRNRINATWSVSVRLVIILVLIPYFLFQVGFIGAITNNSNPMPLTLYEHDHNFFTRPETAASKWLADKAAVYQVYGDSYAAAHLYRNFGGMSATLPPDPRHVPTESYIFLRRWNILNGDLLLFRIYGAQVIPDRIDLDQYSAYSVALSRRSKLYDAGGAQILK